MPFDEPLCIIELQPLEERLAGFLLRLERADSQELFLERSDEPFLDPIAFRNAYKRQTGCDAQESEFSLKFATHILTAMIMAHL